MPIPRNKAVVGENAFAHEAGIHQHGMLKHHSTYEIMRPEDVGLSRSHLVLGKHSGRHAFRERVKALGFELEELELNRVFEEFKALADRKKELFDGDIEALVLRAEGSAQRTVDARASSTTDGGAATRRRRRWCSLRHTDGRTLEQPARAATVRWMRPSRRSRPRPAFSVMLRKFEVHAVTEGEDAQGEARVYVEYNRTQLTAARASAPTSSSRGTRAFLEVINRIELAQAGSRARAGRGTATPAVPA